MIWRSVNLITMRAEIRVGENASGSEKRSNTGGEAAEDPVRALLLVEGLASACRRIKHTVRP